MGNCYIYFQQCNHHLKFPDNSLLNSLLIRWPTREKLIIGHMLNIERNPEELMKMALPTPSCL